MNGLTVNDYLDNLELDRQEMVNSLKSKGMEISDSATFTEIVPKIDGLVDINEYMIDTITYGDSNTGGWVKTLLKFRSPLKVEGTNADYMFYKYPFSEVPFIDSSNINSMRNMFNDCKSPTIPQIDTSNVTNMYGMFDFNSSITNIPLLNTSKVTNMQQMFNNCSNLITIPQLDTSNVTNMQNMFNWCSKIDNIPLLNASSVTMLFNTFNQCNNLKNFGGLKDLGKAYETTQSANYGYYSLELNYTSLTHESLMNVINNLYDIATKGCQPQQLKLGSTNLAKLTEEEISIATNKGWNVVA